MTPGFLELKRRLPAEIGRVFAAWSSAEMLARWFVCAPGWTATAISDFRVGGKYRIEMRSDGRLVGAAAGEYREIAPPHRLVFTWSSEGGISVGHSLVTVELTAAGAHTDLRLVHDLAPDSAAGRAHGAGWRACLDSLDRLLEPNPTQSKEITTERSG